MKKSKMAGAHLCALLTCLIWGTTFISSKKLLLADFSVFDVLFYRFLIGYLALALVAYKPLSFAGIKKEFWMCMAALFGVTLYFLGENMALTYTTTANVGVIVSTAPMFTALLAFLFLKEEKPGIPFFIGFCMAMAGICLISFQGGESMGFHLKGDLLALMASLMWAVYTIILKKFVVMEKNMLATTRRILFYGLITMLPLSFLFGAPRNPLQVISWEYLPNLLFLGLGASALCYLTWNKTLHTLGALRCSNYIYIIPVVTIVASALFLQEGITAKSLAGVLLTIAGLVISENKFSFFSRKVKKAEV